MIQQGLGQWLLGALLALSSSTLWAAGNSASPVQSVPALDLQRYMGSWYEIAKLPNWFQRKCAQGTKATYKILGPQQIEVTNQCVTASGDMMQAIGLARPNASGLPAQLEVRFAPEWMSWLPAVWGNYWVLDLDADYQLAAVGDPSLKYLWVLSRTPGVPAAAYEALLKRLTAMGFDVGQLEKTKQP